MMVAHSEKEQSSMAVRKPRARQVAVLCGLPQMAKRLCRTRTKVATYLFLTQKMQIDNRIGFGMTSYASGFQL